MSISRITITIDHAMLKEIDRFVSEGRFASRSGTIHEAIIEMLKRLKRERLVRECAKLDAKAEQQMAEEGFAADMQAWIKY